MWRSFRTQGLGRFNGRAKSLGFFFRRLIISRQVTGESDGTFHLVQRLESCLHAIDRYTRTTGQACVIRTAGAGDEHDLRIERQYTFWISSNYRMKVLHVLKDVADALYISALAHSQYILWRGDRIDKLIDRPILRNDAMRRMRDTNKELIAIDCLTRIGKSPHAN